MQRLYRFCACILMCWVNIYAQSPSFQTYVNPVIPGDHPDPTLTKIGDFFYTSGSSFNPTPKIYRSTDLVHWEVIAQPVSAGWATYGDSPGGGIWGGHMVYHNEKFWHYFGRGGGSMYFVTADQPEGPWSTPTRVTVPADMPGLGVDNSIFIDDDTGSWYLLAKHGRENNHIVDLGEDGQPTGVVLDLTWLNPDAEGNPYGWAEGPVMWKHGGYYYYSFAQHLAGAQYVMRSATLTDDERAWTIANGAIFTGSRGIYRTPNHISPVIELDDGTSWTIAHSYHGSSNWNAHGRQGLLCQVSYNNEGFPVIEYPSDNATQAPMLPSGGVSWMVPKSDMFNDSDLKPEWSFLGYTNPATYSLDVRPGWFYLEPIARNTNTIVQNDGEHSFSLITRVDFEPTAIQHQAGLWVINGPETHQARVYCSQNSDGENMFVLRFDGTVHEAPNTIGTIVWLKLVRNEHMISGFYSADGFEWYQIGEAIDATAIDIEQTQFNDFTGNQQGLYVQGKLAYFDLYIYRDAYTDIPAQHPANNFGVTPASTLDGISNNEWAMYAGIEFGAQSAAENQGVDYQKQPDQVHFECSSTSSGGLIEVWLDSLDTGQKITEVTIENTGSNTDFKTFSANVADVSGQHDVYLRFTGAENERLFQINSFKFSAKPTTSVHDDNTAKNPTSIALYKNYPNPFNPVTQIDYSIPTASHLKLIVYNLRGEKVATLYNGMREAGHYTAAFDGKHLPSGVYLCKMEMPHVVKTRKIMLLK